MKINWKQYKLVQRPTYVWINSYQLTAAKKVKTKKITKKDIDVAVKALFKESNEKRVPDTFVAISYLVVAKGSELWKVNLHHAI